MEASIFAALWWQSAVSDKAHQTTHSECHLNNSSAEILVPIAPPFYSCYWFFLASLCATMWTIFGTNIVMGSLRGFSFIQVPAIQA